MISTRIAERDLTIRRHIISVIKFNNFVIYHELIRGSIFIGERRIGSSPDWIVTYEDS